MLDILHLLGPVVGVVVIAAALWSLGVTEPFVLTALALIVGIPLGWWVEQKIFSDRPKK
jgi:hypothetical protein